MLALLSCIDYNQICQPLKADLKERVATNIEQPIGIQESISWHLVQASFVQQRRMIVMGESDSAES